MGEGHCFFVSMEHDGDALAAKDAHGFGGAEAAQWQPVLGNGHCCEAEVFFPWLQESGDAERIGPMPGDEHSATHAAGTEDGLDLGEGLGEAIGITQAFFKKQGLAAGGADGADLQRDAGDGRTGGEAVEMTLEHAEEHLCIARRLGDAELAVVTLIIGETKREQQSGGDEPGIGEADAEPVQHAAQEEEQGLQTLDGMLEVVLLAVANGGPDEAQEALAISRREVPEQEALAAEPGGDVLPGEFQKVAECLDAPGLQDGARAG